MAKIKIPFNGVEYDIDRFTLSTAVASLKSHLSTAMNGSGAKINLNGVTYDVDATQLQSETNDFISYLGSIAGSGSKVTIGGVEYNIDSSKMSGAISDLETAFNQLVESSDNVTWLTGDTATISDGVAQFTNVGYLENGKRRKIHGSSVIEVVIDGVVITCPLEGVTPSEAYTTIGSYNGFDIQIGAWALNRQTGLYMPKVMVPDNTTSVTYKYPSMDATLEVTG